MARSNQGYYKEIIKRFQDIESENENLNSNYELSSIDHKEVLWGCLEKCSCLHDECNSLTNDLEALIRSQKFEIEETKDKYKIYKSAFGFQFSDSEIQSINGFAIDRE